MEVLNNYLANSVDLYGGGGGGGGVENSILDVNVLPISNIKENVFYRTNNADKYFIYDNQKYQDNSVVCYKCDGTYAYASGTQLNIELTPGNVDSYLWDTVDDTLINDLLNQEISGVHPIEIVSFDNCQTTVDYFIKYDTNKYDSASNFTKQTDYTSQLQYYKNNEWHIVDNLQIDSIKLTPTTTRANLELIGEEDIIKNSDFETPKANGIDIILDDGQASNPDIINDDVAYKYANNKTSSNNYINTRLETIERKADAKTITKFVDALPANPDINTEYYVSAGTNNYNRYFVDSLGNVRSLGSTQMDVSTLATKQEVNLKQDISNLTTTLNANSTNTQYPSAKAVFDNFAPITSTYSTNSLSTNADNCVFNVRNTTGGREIQQKTFFASITDPIAGGSIYGDCKTTIFYEGTDEAGIHSQTTIKQELDIMYAFSGHRKSFVRYGTLPGTYSRAVEDNKANITWLAWTPVEYPKTDLTLTSANTSLYGASTSISCVISGGVLTIAIEKLDIAYIDQTKVISPTASSFQFRINQFNNLPLKTNNAIYSNLYKDPAETTNTTTENMLLGLTNESGTNYLRCYWCFPHKTSKWKTGRYAGFVIQSLGY